MSRNVWCHYGFPGALRSKCLLPGWMILQKWVVLPVESSIVFESLLVGGIRSTWLALQSVFAWLCRCAFEPFGTQDLHVIFPWNPVLLPGQTHQGGRPIINHGSTRSKIALDTSRDTRWTFKWEKWEKVQHLEQRGFVVIPDVGGNLTDISCDEEMKWKGTAFIFSLSFPSSQALKNDSSLLVDICKVLYHDSHLSFRARHLEIVLKIRRPKNGTMMTRHSFRPRIVFIA